MSINSTNQKFFPGFSGKKEAASFFSRDGIKKLSDIAYTKPNKDKQSEVIEYVTRAKKIYLHQPETSFFNPFEAFPKKIEEESESDVVLFKSTESPLAINIIGYKGIQQIKSLLNHVKILGIFNGKPS